MNEIVYIGLGSNLENPIMQVQLAIERIACFPETTLIQSSSLYKTKPLRKDINLPDYRNAVVKITSGLSPTDLLAALLELERLHGRIRDPKQRWGSRTLDCDILLYGRHTIKLDHLTIPHPEMLNRRFVLDPLYEIEPTLTIQGFPLIHYIEKLDGNDILEVMK